jgi:hypothetical protein
VRKVIRSIGGVPKVRPRRPCGQRVLSRMKARRVSLAVYVTFAEVVAPAFGLERRRLKVTVHATIPPQGGDVTERAAVRGSALFIN